MLQLSYEISSKDEVKNIFDELFKNDSYCNAKTKLLQVYVPVYISDIIPSLLDEIKNIDSELLVVGLTTYDAISKGVCFDRKAVLSFSLFNDSTINIYALDTSNYKYNIVEYFKKKINRMDDIAGIQFLSTDSSRNNSELLNELSNSEFPVFGAVAARYDDKYKPFIFYEKIYNNVIILVVYRGDKLKIHADFCLGWRPLGKEMTISKVTEDYCVEEIDGFPAAYIYDKYLNVKPNEYFLENTYEFPLSINRNGRLISRSPYAIDEYGRLYFNADIYSGEKVRLSYGNKRYVLNDARNLSAKIKDPGIEAVFLIACYNRKMLLREDIKREISYFESTTSNISGCYVFSEFMKDGEKGGVLHYSLVAISMKEGKGDIINCQIPEEKFVHEKVSEKIPFTERLMHFLEATTQDLLQMATTDQLTGLRNRRSLEEILKYEMAKRENKDNLALILIDIDFFKEVNDTYGHDVGDHVLVKLSEIFKAHVRIEDTIGRWGGEEFILVLPNTGIDGAIEVAERIRYAVEKYEFEDIGKMTISAGVTVKLYEESIEHAFIRVDHGLYQAKNEGRNKVKSV